MLRSLYRFPSNVVFQLLIVGAIAAWFPASVSAETWRSTLYPENGGACYVDGQGRFIQNFSFAGYHAGLDAIPDEILAPVIDVTKPPFSADATGSKDATSAIQGAINELGRKGGGTVFLPPGLYALSITGTAAAAINIEYNNVRLVGAGTDKTYLRLDTYKARGKSLIAVTGQGSWTAPVGTTQRIAENLTYPTQVIPLDGKPQFMVGDWVVLTHNVTADWVKEHNMADLWGPGRIRAATFYRQVIQVDTTANTITIDAPIRYYLLQRDSARVYKVGTHVSEVGLAHFSLGMVEHPGKGWGANDYTVAGTAAYEVHDATAIRFRYAVNSWVNDVHTYKPAENQRYHILSNGILFDQSRFITVTGADFRMPQYRGGGGNGYLYTFMGNDSLISNSSAYYGRHNYDFKTAFASGNVITGSFASAPDGLTSDFHMHLSPANLFDNMTIDQDRLDAGWRGTEGTVAHGLTTTQTVLWNTNGLRYQGGKDAIVYSEQYGRGYVIGTRGPANRVLLGKNNRTLPEDYVEGVGKGDTLVPQSLYYDQLLQRKQGGAIIQCPAQDFLPSTSYLSIDQPSMGKEVRGSLPVQISWKETTGAVAKSVAILLDSQPIYSGNSLPTNYTVDTLKLNDGEHTLEVKITLHTGSVASSSVRFLVDNHWLMQDDMQAPITNGWLGFLDLSTAVDSSKGWIYAVGNTDDFWGDKSRRIRSQDTSEYLVWEAPGLEQAVASFYVLALTDAERVRFAVSADNATWTDVSYVTTEKGKTAAGWIQLDLQSNGVPVATKFFRLTLLPTGTQPDRLQLGKVLLQGLQQ